MKKYRDVQIMSH